MKARTRRLIASLLALLIPAFAVWETRRPEATPAPTPAALDLPERIGPWELAVERSLDPEVWDQIQPDFHTFRLYRAPGRNSVALYVGMYRGRAAREAAHDPMACYPAQGWEILGSDSVGVEVPLTQEQLVATHMRIERQEEERDTLYWFQPAGRWPGSTLFEHLLRIVDAVADRPQYAFVRLSTMEMAETDTQADLEEFAAAFAPTIRASVDSLQQTTRVAEWDASGTGSGGNAEPGSTATVARLPEAPGR